MSDKVKLFLSWSGDSSRKIAEIFKDWLFPFSNELDIFFTPDGIEAGKRWTNELSQKLQDCEIGIFVYTRQNLDSLWMAFEAGALSKRIDTGRVIPLIFGEPELKLKQPLAQFQAKRFSERGIFETLEAVNNCLSSKKTKEELTSLLKFTWATLDEKVTQVLEIESDSEMPLDSNDRIDVSEILNNLYSLIRTSPVYSTDFAKDISELVEQIKTTNRGSYLFIDGEKPAFAALIAATMRAKRYIRSTRFSPMPISGNQDAYGEAICARVIRKSGSNNCVERYTRIITANDEAKLQDIDGYLEQFPGCRFDLYLTKKSNSFEMVIIDEEELFIHFYDQGQVINSTLHIVGSEVTKNFIDIYQQFHDLKYNPDILKIDFEYMKKDEAKYWGEKIREFFKSS
jgi:TIR domain